MAEEDAGAAVTFGHAVDAALSQLENARGAAHGFGAGRREKRGVQFGGECISVEADVRLDREPHGNVGRCHQGGAVDHAPRAFEGFAERQFDGAFRAVYRNDAKPVCAHKARAIEYRL
ncbi:MAG: hypothetical protein O2975_05545 [Proteobacteria bacterium]|nr:hypothetical protein [Pseudomonadota bacterium]